MRECMRGVYENVYEGGGGGGGRECLWGFI
jgi:hypothetical protein